jgi:hypothetical protein
MIEQYTNSPEDIPVSDKAQESSTPRSPSVDRPYPEYSSVFEGGGRQMSKTNRFIPQIPLSVLEHYLCYKNNKSGATNMYGGGGSSSMQPMQQMMQPMQQMMQPMQSMNVPVVATMPMTMNMPMQLGGTNVVASGGNGNGNGSNNATTTNVTNNSNNNANNNANSAANNENSNGVRTFSIKL